MDREKSDSKGGQGREVPEHPSHIPTEPEGTDSLRDTSSLVLFSVAAAIHRLSELSHVPVPFLA